MKQISCSLLETQHVTIHLAAFIVKNYLKNVIKGRGATSEIVLLASL